MKKPNTDKNIHASPKTVDRGTELHKTCNVEIHVENQEKPLPTSDDLKEFFNVTNPILKQRNRCKEDSGLYAALNNLYEDTKELPFNIIESLAKTTKMLLDNIEDPDIPDKTISIDAFINHSKLLIKDENYVLKSVLLSVAITAAIAVIAGLIGFGIGCALGLWTGPGAFFTELATGNACAVAVAGETSVVSLGMLAYTNITFFKASPVLQAIKNVAQEAQEKPSMSEPAIN